VDVDVVKTSKNRKLKTLGGFSHLENVLKNRRKSLQTMIRILEATRLIVA